MTQVVNVYPTCKRNPFTGYGKLEIGLLRGLESIGVETALYRPDHQPPVSRVAPVTIVTALPKAAQKCRGKVLLYTMSESTRVSRAWVDDINRYCTAVLVPCPDLVGIYQQSGVTVPVWDVGCG